MILHPGHRHVTTPVHQAWRARAEQLAAARRAAEFLADAPPVDVTSAAASGFGVTVRTQLSIIVPMRRMPSFDSSFFLTRCVPSQKIVWQFVTLSLPRVPVASPPGQISASLRTEHIELSPVIRDMTSNKQN